MAMMTSMVANARKKYKYTTVRLFQCNADFFFIGVGIIAAAREIFIP